MTKVVFLLLILIHAISYAQFEKEIEDITAKGGYFIYQECDTTDCPLQVLLPASLDIRKVEAFYLVFTYTGAFTSFVSHGGQNNHLWTDQLIGIEQGKGKTHLLIRIFWQYSEERWGTCDFCILGKYSFAVLTKAKEKEPFDSRIMASGKVSWQRK